MMFLDQIQPLVQTQTSGSVVTSQGVEQLETLPARGVASELLDRVSKMLGGSI